MRALAATRLERIRDLQAELAAVHAENTRLRADLALAGHRLPCGGCQRLADANARLDAELERCRAEHVDRDEYERVVDDAARLRAALAQRVIGAVW